MRRNRLFLRIGIAAGVVGAALILGSLLVACGSSSGSSGTDVTTTRTTPTATTPETTAAVPGAADTIALFRGIPQRLNGLGKASAPVTMVEFADLQCPVCAHYTLDAMPALVDEYVRTGKVKFVFSGMHFIGPDSEKALRAVYAAGLQGRLWQFADLLYKDQGGENEGWVTDDLLRSIGNSLPGFDTKKMLADMSSEQVTNAIALSDQQAQSASVGGTPTFFAGPTGGTLTQVAVSSLTPDAFRPTLDSLTQ